MHKIPDNNHLKSVRTINSTEVTTVLETKQASPLLPSQLAQTTNLSLDTSFFPENLPIEGPSGLGLVTLQVASRLNQEGSQLGPLANLPPLDISPQSPALPG